jgi:hypothetical protein
MTLTPVITYGRSYYFLSGLAAEHGMKKTFDDLRRRVAQ